MIIGMMMDSGAIFKGGYRVVGAQVQKDQETRRWNIIGPNTLSSVMVGAAICTQHCNKCFQEYLKCVQLSPMVFIFRLNESKLI